MAKQLIDSIDKDIGKVFGKHKDKVSIHVGMAPGKNGLEHKAVSIEYKGLTTTLSGNSLINDEYRMTKLTSLRNLARNL